ncbi:MAG: hypothetical protein HY268_32680, partial [Deltaproteobacteria bacterium]|nr:hypothetical protein [Deltaproteobacteria bacterium]
EALSRSAPTWLAQLPGLLETAELETVQRRAAGASRERMLRELAEAVETLTSTGAGTAPPLLVLVCEDLHVSDHSTVEWLAYLARRRGEARLLVIGTYRPAELVVRQHPLRNVVQELKAHNQCQQLLLDLLTEAHVTTYLAQRLQTEEALQVLAQQLHQRTGGNPLFMVNITDYLIHQGVLREEAGGRWRLHGDLTAVETPENLRQMIGTQLDGVSEAERRVLETASVAGNEFTVASVAAALQEELNLVEEICEDLVWKGRFLQERGIAEWPDGTVSGHYEFRHVLYQNVLYRRIGEARRVRLHRLIGERAEAGYGERAREIAAELAVHFEQGREVPRALRYLQRSAENALRRNAYPEAIRALTRGLTLLGTLPEAPERDQQELALQLALGGALVGGENHGALGVDQAYARARILCQRMGETPQLFLALSGMAGFYYSRGNMETGYELAQQCLQVAQRLQHPAFLTSAHATLGLMSVGLGTFADAREHFAQATAFYDARPRRSRSLLPTTDQEVLARSYLAVALWMLGYPDQGLYSAQHALALAEQIEHPPSLGFALTFVGMVQGYRREEQAAQATADRMMAMAQEQALPAWQPHGTYARGEALVLQGQYAQGIEYIRRAIAYCTSMGIESGQTWRAARLAEAYGKAGDVAMGLQTVDEGFALVRKNGDPFYDAELWRTKGELLLNAERRRMKDEG